MKPIGLSILVKLGISAALALLSCAAVSAPCTTPTDECSEFVIVSGGPSRSFVYRSLPLNVSNEGVRRALITVHGLGRDADVYFRSALAATFLAGALEDTVVVVPRFSSNTGTGCVDVLATNELNWQCQSTAEGWQAGAPALNDAKLTSFDVMDEVLRRLARKEVYPNLGQIVVAGHSSGGRFVSRYAMVNQVHDQLRVPVSYVVANPSAYAYLDSLRPTLSALPPRVAAAAPGYLAPTPAIPPEAFVQFADARNCTTFDRWPYGLQERTGASARLPEEQLRRQSAGRPTTYLLGELDILPLYGFDSSCAAMAQGPTRLARGLAFAKHINDRHGGQHKVIVVPACGHSARCMFGADVSLPVLFPKQ